MAPIPSLRPVLAALSEYPSVGESLEFQLTGLIVVFIALGGIWGLLEATGWCFRRAESWRAERVAAAARLEKARIPPAPEAAPPAAAEPVETGLPPAIAAAIVAAVFIGTLGRPHRITAITPLDSSLDWAREGRRTIFGSHKTR